MINYILTRLIIRRLKKDARKYHSKISAYSQALINCAVNHKSKPIVKNGFWFIGDIQKEFCRIKNVKYEKSVGKWIKLSSWNRNKNLEFNECL